MNAASDPGLCLAMIVRNEVAVLDRALDSVLPFVDTWRIIDTGSDDGTPELVRARLGHLDGQLRHSTWIDFGTNRSELVAWATEAADWLLLLDADMTVDADADLRRQLDAFDADAAMVAVEGGITYRMPYLVRGGLPWSFTGRTHEYLSCGVPFSTGWFDGLRVRHHGDGGTRDEKLDRDVRLLHRDLLDDPANSRTHFYLAQTLRDAGDLATAIEHYQRRVELGGWEEEVFFAQYQVGLLEDRLGREACTESLLRAWDLRPTRAEPMYHLARINRLRGHHHLAWIFSTLAASIPKPDDLLFVESWIYDWAASFEQVDAGWRIGHDDLVRQGAAALLARDDLPDDHRDHLLVIVDDLAGRGEDPDDGRACSPRPEGSTGRPEVERADAS